MPCPKCADGWVCEQHPQRPWPHDDCPGPGMPCAACCVETAEPVDMPYREPLELDPPAE